jgi:biopolymer transport protein ExbB
MLENADAVIWLTAITLLVMSIISWTLIITKGRRARQLRMTSATLAKSFWQSRSLEDGLALIAAKEPAPFLSTLAREAIRLRDLPLDANSLDGQSPTEDRITRALRDTLQSTTDRMDSGLVTLASIGATSPFVGLFGTVWSIYHALISISGSGEIMIEQVAGPVGEALIMTAFGLVVAIPAVLAYNALTRSHRLALATLDGFANDLRAQLIAKR